jgi:hypothetical protein
MPVGCSRRSASRAEPPADAEEFGDGLNDRRAVLRLTVAQGDTDDDDLAHGKDHGAAEEHDNVEPGFLTQGASATRLVLTEIRRQTPLLQPGPG